MIEEKSLVYLIIRLVLGCIFIYHGISKLGGGYNPWIEYMKSLGITTFPAVFAIVLEILIGLGLLFGLYTRITALTGILFMIIAVYLAHRNDPILGEKGIGYQILIILMCIGLTVTEGGKYSVM